MGFDVRPVNITFYIQGVLKLKKHNYQDQAGFIYKIIQGYTVKKNKILWDLTFDQLTSAHIGQIISRYKNFFTYFYGLVYLILTQRQFRQCMYIAPLGRIFGKTTAVEKQYVLHILSVCL